MTQYTKDDLFKKFTKVLEELFEIEPENVTLQSRLVEDLDLDSIDAVDMIVKLQNFIGRRIKPEDFKSVRTVEDVLNVLLAMQEAHGGETTPAAKE